MPAFNEYEFDVDLTDVAELRERYGFPPYSQFDLAAITATTIQSLEDPEKNHLPDEAEQDITEIFRNTARFRIKEGILKAQKHVLDHIKTCALHTQWNGKILHIKLIA